MGQLKQEPMMLMGYAHLNSEPTYPLSSYEEASAQLVLIQRFHSCLLLVVRVLFLHVLPVSWLFILLWIGLGLLAFNYVIVASCNVLGTSCWRLLASASTFLSILRPEISRFRSRTNEETQQTADTENRRYRTPSLFVCDV